MRSATPLLIAAIAAMTCLSLGCSADSSDAATTEDALDTTRPKVLFRGVAHPSGLAVTEGHVYFGSNKFVASGDPELDQQFAYWTGKFSRVARAGGRAETVNDVGPINRVRMSGRKMFYSMGSGCWISSFDTSRPAGTQSRGAYDLEGCEPDSGPTLAGFEVTSDRLIAVHTDGKVISVKHDGSDKKAIAELRIGDWGDLVEATALGDGKIFLLTASHLTDSRGRAVPQAIHAVALDTGRISKLTELSQRPANFISDGKNLFWSQEKKKVMTLADGAREPKLVSEDFREVIDLAADGNDVYVGDSERDAVYQVKSATTAPTQKKLGDVKGVRAITVSGMTLVYGSHVVDGRRAAGVIGTLPIGL